MLNSHYYSHLDGQRSKLLNGMHDYIQRLTASSDNNDCVKLVSLEDSSLNFTLGQYKVFVDFSIRTATKLIIVETFEILPNFEFFPNNKMSPIRELKAACNLAGYFKLVGTGKREAVDTFDDPMNAGRFYYNKLSNYLEGRERAEYNAFDEETKELFR
jgi:hypothetical protein